MALVVVQVSFQFIMVSLDEQGIRHSHTLGSLGGHHVRDARGTLDALSTKISRDTLSGSVNKKISALWSKLAEKFHSLKVVHFEPHLKRKK